MTPHHNCNKSACSVFSILYRVTATVVIMVTLTLPLHAQTTQTSPPPDSRLPLLLFLVALAGLVVSVVQIIRLLVRYGWDTALFVVGMAVLVLTGGLIVFYIRFDHVPDLITGHLIFAGIGWLIFYALLSRQRWLAELRSTQAALMDKNKELEEFRRRSRNLLASLPDVIMISDPDGNIHERNYESGISSVFNIDSSRRLEDLDLPRKALNELQQNLAKAFSKNRPIHLETAIPTEDGTNRFEFRIHPIDDDRAAIVVRNRTVELLPGTDGSDSLLWQAPTGMMIADQDGLISRVNEGMAAMLSMSTTELSGKKLSDITYPADIDEELRVLRSTRDDKILDKRFLTAQGKPVWTRVFYRRIKDRKTPIFLILAVDVDSIISARQAEFPGEKVDMIRELNHRAKNSLQIVSGLLAAGAHEHKNIDDFIHETQNRIKAMALAQEKLHFVDRRLMLDFADFARELTTNLCFSYGIRDIRIEVGFNNMLIDSRVAIQLGLCLHEAVINILKHAFIGLPETGNKVLRLSLMEDDTANTLLIEDNGQGMPEDFSLKDSDSLGMSLMRAILSQMGGELIVLPGLENCTGGYGTRLIFRIPVTPQD